MYEIVIAVSIACLILLLFNINRITQCPVKMVVGFVCVSYFLFGGLARYEDLGEIENLFLTWGIGGAIAVYSFRGALAIGCAGGIVGFFALIIVGFIFCPLYWLMYVFIIISNSFRVAFGYNVVISLISVLSVTVLLWKQEIVINEHRQYGDGKTCCGVYVQGQKLNGEGDWVAATTSRQALVTGEVYTPASLEPSCGYFAPFSQRRTSLFRLSSGSTPDAVSIHTYHDSSEIQVYAPTDGTLKPGSMVSFIPKSELANASSFDMSKLDECRETLRKNVRRLKVEALLYAQPDGSVRGHTNNLRKFLSSVN